MGSWVKVIGGVVIGFVAARYLLPAVGLGGKAVAETSTSAGRPPMARIADDTLYACQQLRPVLTQLREVTQDRELSVSDIWLMYQQVNRLT
jgi:hypothetical protein